MRDSVVVAQIELLHSISGSGRVDAVFTPPCGVTSVLRFKLLATHPVLVTTAHFVGVPGLSFADTVKVKTWLQLCSRSCVHATCVFDAGWNFIFEARPTRRNATDGPFAPCCGRTSDGALKFPLHYTIWQTPPFIDLIKHCGLEFLRL